MSSQLEETTLVDRCPLKTLDTYGCVSTSAFAGCGKREMFARQSYVSCAHVALYGCNPTPRGSSGFCSDFGHTQQSVDRRLARDGIGFLRMSSAPPTLPDRTMDRTRRPNRTGTPHSPACSVVRSTRSWSSGLNHWVRVPKTDSNFRCFPTLPCPQIALRLPSECPWDCPPAASECLCVPLSASSRPHLASSGPHLALISPSSRVHLAPSCSRDICLPSPTYGSTPR